MGSLILNSTLYEHLKINIQFWLLVLPFSIMFCSIFLLILIEPWADKLPMSLVITIIMLSGVAFGWQCNKLVASWFFRWPADKVQAVYSNSEVPLHWFKEGGFKQYRGKLIEAYQNRDEEPPSLVYVACKSALMFYVFISLYVVVINPFLHEREINNFHFALWPAPAFGVLFGTVVIFANRWSIYTYKKAKHYVAISSYLNGDNQQNIEKETSGPSTFGKVLTGINLVITITVLALIAVGTAFLLNYVLFDETFDVPAKESLYRVTGTINSVEKKKERIHFTVTDTPYSFTYPERGGASDRVFKELNSHLHSNVVLLAQRPSSLSFDEAGPKPLKVYQINIGNESLRTYSEIKTAINIWRAVIGVMVLLLGAFCVLAAIGLWNLYFKKSG